MKNNIIQIQKLYKSFAKNEILKGIDFDINKGDVSCIIGPSGSGKSTFLRCINLLERPTSGKIIYNGENVLKNGYNIDKYRSKVGMVFQQFNLFNNLSIIENCTVGQIKVLKKNKTDARKNAIKFLEKVQNAEKRINGTIPN